jgi:DNA-binding PadR family transcriptional regulator
MRILATDESNGYDVMKQLASEGVSLPSNYVYTVLSEMEDEKLLAGRWQDSEKGPRKHFFTLSEAGQTEYRKRQKDSLDFLMGTYVKTNFSRADLPSLIKTYAKFLKQVYYALGARFPEAVGTKLVMAVPYFDPLTYHPIEYYSMSEAFPNASLYLIKPTEMKVYESRTNFQVADGFRHDMPLRDGFADHLYLRGFPKSVDEKKTVDECLRVLGKDGDLVVQLSNIMTQEKSPLCPSFSEFLSRLFYDLYDQDRIVSLEDAKEILSTRFKKVKDIESCGNTYLYARQRIRPERFQTVAVRSGNR